MIAASPQRMAGAETVLSHLLGVGPDEAFATARQLTSGPISWFGNVEKLETFQQPAGLIRPYIILLDGDLPLERLVAFLDQNAAMLQGNPIILQVTKPPVRSVVEIMQRGVRDVLQKPFSLARLTFALEELRGQRGRRPP